jgi:hypothetical protein
MNSLNTLRARDTHRKCSKIRPDQPSPSLFGGEGWPVVPARVGPPWGPGPAQFVCCTCSAQLCAPLRPFRNGSTVVASTGALKIS